MAGVTSVRTTLQEPQHVTGQQGELHRAQASMRIWEQGLGGGGQMGSGGKNCLGVRPRRRPLVPHHRVRPCAPFSCLRPAPHPATTWLTSPAGFHLWPRRPDHPLQPPPLAPTVESSVCSGIAQHPASLWHGAGELTAPGPSPGPQAWSPLCTPGRWDPPCRTGSHRERYRLTGRARCGQRQGEGYSTAPPGDSGCSGH